MIPYSERRRASQSAVVDATTIMHEDPDNNLATGFGIYGGSVKTWDFGGVGQHFATLFIEFQLGPGLTPPRTLGDGDQMTVSIVFSDDESFPAGAIHGGPQYTVGNGSGGSSGPAGSMVSPPAGTATDPHPFQFELPFTNCVDGTQYRYMRVHFEVTGSPVIRPICYVSQNKV